MALLGPQLAMATITFDQLDDDVFVVSHRVKLLGSRGQAVRMVYEKAGSLCVAAGYTHFEIQDQQSQAWQTEEDANASIRAQFFLEDGKQRLACMNLASSTYIEQANVKLRMKGYRPPARAATHSADTPEEIGTSTAEQISAMTQVRLSAQQIQAACREAGDAPPSRVADVPAH